MGAYQLEHWFAPAHLGMSATYHNWDRDAATRRALSHADRSVGSSDTTHVWNFVFGSNLNPDKVASRGMRPAAVQRGQLPGWKLVFNHNGGYGNIESLDTINRDGLDFSRLSKVIEQPAGVHGVLLKLTREDFSRLAWEEYAYNTIEVPVEVYDVDQRGSRIQHAIAFKTVPCAITNSNTLPTARYIGLIQNGARVNGLQPQYCRWLDSISPSL